MGNRIELQVTICKYFLESVFYECYYPAEVPFIVEDLQKNNHAEERRDRHCGTKTPVNFQSE